MRSSSPGSWSDLLWRLRAETAAAEAGDYTALAVLAAGATLAEPPPDGATVAEALRLVRRVRQRTLELAERIAALRALPPESTVPPRRLDIRR
jgi:hypothetical protein